MQNRDLARRKRPSLCAVLMFPGYEIMRTPPHMFTLNDVIRRLTRSPWVVEKLTTAGFNDETNAKN